MACIIAARTTGSPSRETSWLISAFALAVMPHPPTHQLDECRQQVEHNVLRLGDPLRAIADARSGMEASSLRSSQYRMNAYMAQMAIRCGRDSRTKE